MDEGPFRVPHPTDKSDDKPPEEENKPVIQPKPIQERPKTVHRSSHPSLTEKKSKKKIFIIIGAVLAAAIVLLGGFAVWNGMQSGGTGIDGGKYQAVFLTNGQTYFGKLQKHNDEYLKLKEVYYLQTQGSEAADSKNSQNTQNDQNVQLIKLGDELHGPEDEMIIAKDQVLFYENLKKDGKVSKSIENFKNPN